MATSRVLIPVLACLMVTACQSGSKDDAAPQSTAEASKAPAVTAAQAPGNIVGSGIDQTYDCGGRPVNIAGSRNTLRLTGSCPTLNLIGTGNKVTVDKAGVINITGHDNTVTWGTGLSGDAHVNDLGRNNTVSHGAGAP